MLVDKVILEHIVKDIIQNKIYNHFENVKVRDGNILISVLRKDDSFEDCEFVPVRINKEMKNSAYIYFQEKSLVGSLFSVWFDYDTMVVITGDLRNSGMGGLREKLEEAKRYDREYRKLTA